MELLKKTIEHDEEKREDNSDKKKLFSKNHHPRKAVEYKEDWLFIKDDKLRDNIAYQLQYLEFTVYLYNDYQIYLTIESLHCKNIIVTIASIIESALYDLIEQASQKIDYNMEERRDFAFLIKLAYEMDYIDKDIKNDIHELRKMRNRMHMSGTGFQEYNAYTVEHANYYIGVLDRFRKMMNNFK